MDGVVRTSCVCFGGHADVDGVYNSAMYVDTTTHAPHLNTIAMLLHHNTTLPANTLRTCSTPTYTRNPIQFNPTTRPARPASSYVSSTAYSF